eukprot:IDg4628t1
MRDTTHAHCPCFRDSAFSTMRATLTREPRNVGAHAPRHCYDIVRSQCWRGTARRPTIPDDPAFISSSVPARAVVGDGYGWCMHEQPPLFSPSTSNFTLAHTHRCSRPGHVRVVRWRDKSVAHVSYSTHTSHMMCFPLWAALKRDNSTNTTTADRKQRADTGDVLRARRRSVRAHIENLSENAE